MHCTNFIWATLRQENEGYSQAVVKWMETASSRP